MKYRYLDNAYWEEADRSKLKCIKMTQLEDKREKKTILEVDRDNQYTKRRRLYIWYWTNWSSHRSS